MKHITTYLHFNGTCRQAMQFYQRCLGGDLTLNTYPDATGTPATAPDAPIMHAQLSHGGTPQIMASDSTPQGLVTPGNNFSIAVECTSTEEIDRLFASVGASGTVRMPVSDVPWGARFGMLTDQFGVQWFFNYTK